MVVSISFSYPSLRLNFGYLFTSLFSAMSLDIENVERPQEQKKGQHMCPGVVTVGAYLGSSAKLKDTPRIQDLEV